MLGLKDKRGLLVLKVHLAHKVQWVILEPKVLQELALQAHKVFRVVKEHRGPRELALQAHKDYKASKALSGSKAR